MNTKYDYSRENLEKLAKESWCQCDMYYKLTGRWKNEKVLKKYIKLYNIDTSHWTPRKSNPQIQLTCSKDQVNSSKTKLQKNILDLRKKGKSYREIASILNCSKGTISYNLRIKTREQTKQRKNDILLWKRNLVHNISSFRNKKYRESKQKWNVNWKDSLINRTINFRNKMKNNKIFFNYKDVLAKYNNQTKIQCYLTGDWIDITKDKYALDHIIPISRGGNCSLDNLAITNFLANASKSNMTEEEYVELCKKVLIHHGYKVEKE